MRHTLLHRDERGASAVEYGLLIVGIAVVIIAAVVLFGGKASDLFSGGCDSVANAAAQSSC